METQVNALKVKNNDSLFLSIENLGCSCISIQVPPSRGAESAILKYINEAKHAGKSVILLCTDEVVANNYLQLTSNYPNISKDYIQTVQNAELNILQDEDIQKEIGRSGRLIDENENDVLLEDVKVTGVKPKRLREMLKFFYNSIANCADEEPNWIISDEEQQVYNVFIRNLEERKSILPCELSSLMYKGIKTCGKDLKNFGADIVIVDSFNSLSKSSQRLVRSLAGEIFIALGNNTEIPSISEPYPNPKGFEEFSCEDETKAILFAPEKPKITASIYTVPNPNAEFDVVAKNVSEILNNSADKESILIGVPNKIWAGKINSKLHSLGIDSSLDFGISKLKGDPRYVEKSGQIAARSFFRLYIDKNDMTALRTWIGLGDWLLCSEAFLELMAHATENNISTLEALKNLHADTKEASDKMFFHKLNKRLTELDEIMSTYKSGNKEEILSTFEKQHIEINKEAKEIFNNAGNNLNKEKLNEIAFAGNGNVAGAKVTKERINNMDANVVVAPYKRCIGRKPQHLMLCGMVNGFFPSLRAVDDKYSLDERAKNKECEAEFFNYLKEVPSKSLTLSLFEEDILENAGKLKMDTTRIFYKDEQRCAKIAPSIFIENLKENTK